MNMKIVLLEKVTNRIILEMTPVEKYAELFDEKIPAFFSDLIDWLEKATREDMRGVFDTSFLRNWSDEYLEEHKQELLVYLLDEFFAETDYVQSDYVQSMEADEFDCYAIYLCFFAQYRNVTGENLTKDMSYSDILTAYKTLGDDFLDKYVITDYFVPGKGRIYSYEYAIPICDDKVKDFETIATGLDLYVSDEDKKQFAELNKCKNVIPDIAPLRSCDALRFYMDRSYDEYWHFTVFSNDMTNIEDGNNEPLPFGTDDEELPFGTDDEELPFGTDDEELPFYADGEGPLYDYDIIHEEGRYDLKSRLYLMYRDCEEYMNNQNVMLFASCYFDECLFDHILFSNNVIGGTGKDFKTTVYKKIYKSCVFHLSVKINHISEEMALSDDKDKKIQLFKELENYIEPMLRSMVLNIGDSGNPYVVRIDALRFLPNRMIRGLLFKVFSSSDMRYVLLNKFRLEKNEVSFRELLFCICFEVSYLFSAEKPDYGFSEIGLIDIYIMILNKIISSYRPLFDAMDRGEIKADLRKIDNPYSVFSDFEALALYTEELYLDGEDLSDSLIAQEHLYICAYLFDVFSIILGINSILLDDIKGTEVFAPKEYLKEIRKVTSEYRHFYVSMIDHVFDDYYLAEEYSDSQDIRRIDENERKNEEKKQVNFYFQNVIETVESILKSEISSPIEIAEYRQVILRALGMMNIEQGNADDFIDRLVLKLVRQDSSDIRFNEIYNTVRKELKSLYKCIDESIIKTLATAEYFYSIYIDEKDEIENFDYSCFSILYYRCFEDALNCMLYVPYRTEFEEDAVVQANRYGVNDSRADLIPSGVNGLIKYSARTGSYFLSERLPLGGMSFFIKYISNSKNSEIKQWLSSICKNISGLYYLSDEILEVSKKRNIAAHGSEVLPAKALIESKNYVFNKAYSQKLRNMLIRFMKTMQG